MVTIVLKCSVCGDINKWEVEDSFDISEISKEHFECSKVRCNGKYEVIHREG